MIDFALLGHPADLAHLASAAALTPGLDPALAGEGAALAELFERAPTFAAPEELVVALPGRPALRGQLIICTFLPGQVDTAPGMLAAAARTLEGLGLAREAGARVAGLGGFTSIVTAPRGEALAREFGLRLTSGNTLTAALALAQVEELMGRLGRDLRAATVAVLGASGDIGRGCALGLARRARRLILVARNPARLEALRADLPPGVEALTAVDPGAALGGDLILAATSSPHPLLAEADLRPGTVVCDLGYPPTLASASPPRADVLAFSGGLARTPFQLDIGRYARLPAPDVLYGCFSEAILLALAGEQERVAGPAPVTPQAMEELLALASSFGFGAAPPYRDDKPLTEESLQAFRHALHG